MQHYTVLGEGIVYPPPEWNATRLAFHADRRVHHHVGLQTARTPHAVAVVCRGRRWTYHELDAAADDLAVRLRAAGVGPGVLVAVRLERSLELIAALLGVLKAGGAYVPLDPSYPPERLRLVLDDARPAVLIGPNLEVVPLARAQNDAAPTVPDDAAYVLYTSGSTGTPKGVIVTHRNVSNFFTAIDRVIGPEPGTWLAITSVGFDISVLELFWTLARGFVVVIDDGASVYALAAQITRHAVTHLQCTPSLASMLVRDPRAVAALGRLRRLLIGGEALSPDLAQRLTAAAPDALFNLYGPTETTIWSLAHHVTPADAERVPIGAPIANTSVHVLDPNARPVAIGTPGELYIGGEGVAAGYLNRPDLTAERFVATPHGRRYRTGDIVRSDAEGRLEFLGRIDQQVKIRGVRIELGEIEVLLRQHPAVRDAVVVVREVQPDDKRLAAYVVPSAPRAVDGAALRTWLAERVSEAMLPSAIVFLAAIPLTPNGKIDRQALPDPTFQAPQTPAAATGPATETERLIAGIWADVLGQAAVGATDRFFDLGGHSLLMVDVHGQLEAALGREIPLVDLFEYPTVRTLAAHLSGRDPAAAVPTPTTSAAGARGRLRRSAR
jgi:amino acid adenylation domain-containing protein